MSSQNLVEAVMTDVQRDAMTADLDAFTVKFLPYTVNLTPADIKGLAKLKPTDVAVLDVGLTFMQQNPPPSPATRTSRA